MAWGAKTVENQRLNLVKACIHNGERMTDLCYRFDISRKTAYKWLKRYLQDGEEGLKDLSRAPNEPCTLFTQSQIERAIDLKLKYRTWGPKKILAKLEEIYPDEDWPSNTRLYEIFKGHHLVTKRSIRSRVPATAPLGSITEANDTWAMDFKGWFLTGDGHKCEPLTITDSFTRYLIRCVDLSKHTVEDVWPILDQAFHEYGLPLRIRSDNGNPFGTTGAGRLSRLSVKLIKAGVTPEWTRPGHPEENGRHERFHLTLKQDIATPPKETLALQIQTMSQYEHVYNFERPHEALNMKTPGSCYNHSSRRWDGVLRPPEYCTSMVEVKRVNSHGYMSVANKKYFIGEALVGEYVGLKRNENNSLEAYYGPIYLGKFVDEKFEKPQSKSSSRRK